MIVFIFGAVVGSFLNVVIYRYNTGVSVARGRSMCFSCGKTLAWYELIPIVSFLIQRGKCSVCRSKISWQYPLVEITTAILFLLTIWRQGLQITEFISYWLIIAILVVIAVYDFRHKIIPNSFVYSFIVLSAFLLIWRQGLQISIWTSGFQMTGIWDWLAGPILFLPFASLWFFSKGEWMGFGDAKLAWGIGWFLGTYAGLSAIILAFWTGAVWGLALIGLGKICSLFPALKKFTIKSEIPFGPFLILGTFLVFFFGIDVLKLAQIF
jgi:prepilin signal peptidase PulO-like enzyme (type II secretory pathway)